MLDSEIEKLDLVDLKRLQRDLDKAIATKEQEALLAARKAVEDAAREHGFSLMEIFGSKTKPKRRAEQKYINPEDASQTWSGRGRQPKWVKDALAAGKTLEDLAL